jgi:hypothetical protein
MVAMMSCEALETGPDTLDGIWQCQEVSQAFGNQAYNVTMSYAPNDSTIIRMSNFYNLGTGKVVMAEVDLWELNINTQNVEGLVFNGTGIVSGNRKKIDFSYTVSDGQSTDVVSATFTR